MEWQNGSIFILGDRDAFGSSNASEVFVPSTGSIIMWRKLLSATQETGGIETVDEHVHVFSDMHIIEEEVYLLQALIHAAEASQQFLLDVAAWKSGDTNRLYAMHVRRMKEAPTVWWRVLDQRNSKGIPRLEAAVQSGTPTLVVAGALHFSGPRSVIACCKSAVTSSSSCNFTRLAPDYMRLVNVSPRGRFNGRALERSNPHRTNSEPLISFCF